MKNLSVFKMYLFAALFALLIAQSCNSSSSEPQYDLVGKWESERFEIEGLDATNLYRMTLLFDDWGNCVQTLHKPGNVTVTATLPYSKSADGSTLTIGSAVIAIESFQWADELILVYESGEQPAGFMQDWRAVMRLQ